MDHWENLAAQGIGALGQAGLNFGTAYGQYWLSKEQAENQFDNYLRVRALAPAPPALGGGMFLILAIVAVVLIARR